MRDAASVPWYEDGACIMCGFSHRYQWPSGSDASGHKGSYVACINSLVPALSEARSRIEELERPRHEVAMNGGGGMIGCDEFQRYVESASHWASLQEARGLLVSWSQVDMLPKRVITSLLADTDTFLSSTKENPTDG